MVQSRRNQWLSRFACTKAAAGFGRSGAFSWCKADVINGFSRFACTKGAAGFRRSGAFSWCKADVINGFSRFACTKAAAGFRRRGAFSWCKAYAINGFPGLLAPKPPVSAGAPAGPRATSSAVFPSPWCASGIPVSAFRLLPCASVLRFWASSPRNRRSPGALS